MSQYLPVHTLVFAFWVIMVEPSPISSNDAVQGPTIILLLQQTTGDKQKKYTYVLVLQIWYPLYPVLAPQSAGMS